MEVCADWTSRVLACVSGVGAGKTYTIAAKSVLCAHRHPGYPIAVVEPTYAMIRDVALPTFTTLLEDWRVPYTYHRRDEIIKVSDGETATPILLRSGDKPDRLKGLNLVAAYMDEAGQQSEETFKVLMRRTRVGPEGSTKQVGIFGTPEGGPGTWFARKAEFAPVENTRLVRASTADNPFLDKTFFDTLRKSLSPHEFEQYCLGRFVSAFSRVYSDYEPSRNRQPFRPDPERSARNPHWQLWCDFNVSKMVWLIVLVDNGLAHIVDEVVGEETYTADMIPEVREKLKQYGVRDMATVEVYGDASARQRKTAASRSDLAHFQVAGFKIRLLKRNPPIRDRVAATNAKLRKGTLLVDPKCTEALASLSSQPLNKDGEPDKTKGLDHAADACGYGVYSQWPVLPPRSNTRSYL